MGQNDGYGGTWWDIMGRAIQPAHWQVSPSALIRGFSPCSSGVASWWGAPLNLRSYHRRRSGRRAIQQVGLWLAYKASHSGYGLYVNRGWINSIDWWRGGCSQNSNTEIWHCGTHLKPGGWAILGWTLHGLWWNMDWGPNMTHGIFSNNGEISWYTKTMPWVCNWAEFGIPMPMKLRENDGQP